MKKFVMATLLTATVLASAVGCGKTDDSSSEASGALGTEAGIVNTEAGAALTEAGAALTGSTGGDISEMVVPEDAEILEGTVDEVKDSMFVVKTADEKFYAFNFGENVCATPGDFAAGNTVRLYYSGTLSEIDAFDGTVYKVEVIQ